MQRQGLGKPSNPERRMAGDPHQKSWRSSAASGMASSVTSPFVIWMQRS
jgi:hypothetical protein